jgi:hypothetical protein
MKNFKQEIQTLVTDQVIPGLAAHYENVRLALTDKVEAVVLNKKYQDSLAPLSFDELVVKLGDYCEKVRHASTDKETGTLKTLFNLANTARKEHAMALVNAAAQRIGVELDGMDPTLSAIADAADLKGGAAAAKIRAYVDLVAKCEKEVGKVGNPFKYMKASVAAAKKLG